MVWSPGAYLLLVMLLNSAACTGTAGSPTCIRCHNRLEAVSPSHPDCLSCHRGNGQGSTSATAHGGMPGPRNPAAPLSWEETCGACHQYQLGRVRSTIMTTNAGMIRNIRLSWEDDGDGEYGTTAATLSDAGGKPLKLHPVADLDHLSGELYRKFCSRCHVGSANDTAGVAHAAGCAACHFPYDDTATYRGDDPTMAGKTPAAGSHRMTALPGNDVCFRCHNRSGRIALSYQGLYDGNNSMVPTRNGLPGPVMTSGNRNLTHIAADVHFIAGMDCIDCHTSRDVMGDGFAYRNMYLQTEIGCADCHGTPTTPPRHQAAHRENSEPVRESRQYRQRMSPDMEMVLTSKGRPYSNVFFRDGRILVLGKRSGKLFTSKVISGTPEHLIPGHRRMECYACHSRTAVQCYGCHTTYDKSAMGMDFIKQRETPGEFSETEDYRALYPFPLAINQRGKISTVTPGCQTFLTVIEKDGTKSRQEAVARYKGKHQLRFAPFYSHNTGKKAIGCSECHGNPAFLGFGQHVTSGADIAATLICEKSKTKPLDGFLTMEKGGVKAFSAITRENSRPLNGREIRRVLRVNTCLICHDRGNDPIYRKELDYRALDDSRHRRLLDGR